MKPGALTIIDLLHKKQQGEKITMLTCYDATFARLLDQTPLDAVLVGDSLGMTIQGHDSTLPVTLEDMIYHTRAVRRALHQPFLIADMPFLSYQVSADEGVRNSGLLMQQTHAQAVKLEGGTELVPLIERLSALGVPVVGHLGLQPQRVHMMGGYKLQAKDKESAKALKTTALALEAAGAIALVLEAIPRELAKNVTEALHIPTIGIGSGPDCDGQVLVLQDLLGMNLSFKPRFVRHFAELETAILKAVHAYIDAVAGGQFPNAEESFSLNQKPRSIKK